MNGVHGLAHPFVDVIMLQLNEASADGSNVALLIGEGHAAGSFWVFELRIRVDASVANTSVQPVHDHSQLHWREEEEEKRGQIRATAKTLFWAENLFWIFFCSQTENEK